MIQIRERETEDGVVLEARVVFMASTTVSRHSKPEVKEHSKKVIKRAIIQSVAEWLASNTTEKVLLIKGNKALYLVPESSEDLFPKVFLAAYAEGSLAEG